MKYRRPLAVKLVASLYILAPIINYIHASVTTDLTWSKLMDDPTGPWGSVGLIILLIAPLVAVGIFSRSKVGFFSFIGYSVAVIVYNLNLLINSPGASVSLAVGTDLALGVCISVMLFRDLRVPYLSAEDRGWRLDKRIDCKFPCQIESNGTVLAAHVLNVSSTGAMLSGAGFEPQEGDTVLFNLEVGGENMSISSIVERVSAQGAGVSFRNLSPEQCKKLVEAAENA